VYGKFLDDENMEKLSLKNRSFKFSPDWSGILFMERSGIKQKKSVSKFQDQLLLLFR